MRLIDADALEYELGASEYDIYAKECLKEAPTIELPRWIPVTERLPENLGNRVLVTDGSTVALGHYEQPHWINLETDDFFSAWGWEITHWMPLPTPPKDGET